MDYIQKSTLISPINTKLEKLAVKRVTKMVPLQLEKLGVKGYQKWLQGKMVVYKKVKHSVYNLRGERKERQRETQDSEDPSAITQRRYMIGHT